MWLSAATGAARRFPAAAPCLGGACAIAPSVALASHPGPEAKVHQCSALVAPAAVEAARQAGAARVLVVTASHPQWSTAAGVSAALVAAGFEVTVNEAYLPMYGKGRAATGAEDFLITLFDAGEAIPGLAGGSRVAAGMGAVVHARPLQPGEARHLASGRR